MSSVGGSQSGVLGPRPPAFSVSDFLRVAVVLCCSLGCLFFWCPWIGACRGVWAGAACDSGLSWTKRNHRHFCAPRARTLLLIMVLMARGRSWNFFAASGGVVCWRSGASDALCQITFNFFVIRLVWSLLGDAVAIRNAHCRGDRLLSSCPQLGQGNFGWAGAWFP